MWSKIAQILLLLVVLTFLFLIGRKIHDSTLGWILLFLFIHSPALSGMTEGGLPRAYAVPAVVAFIWAALTERVVTALAAVTFSAVFYPPIVLVLGPSYVLWCLYKRVFTWWNILALVIVILGIFPMVFRGEEIGQIVSFADAKRMPEWHVGNRFPFVPIPAIGKIGVEEFSSAFTPGRFSWIFVLLGIYGMVRHRMIVLGMVLIVSVVMYEFSSLFAFRFHIPDRTIIYTLPVVGLIVAPRMARMAWIALIPAVLLLWGSGFKANLNLWADQRHGAKLYQFISTLPKDAVIAGPPMEMDNIPLFARRIVFVSDEAAQPLYPRFYQEMKRRLKESYAAYYATDERVVREFGVKNRVRYMVVKKEDFTHGLHRGKYYEPYNGYIKSLIHQKSPAEFVAPRLPSIYNDGAYAVVDLSALRGSREIKK